MEKNSYYLHFSGVERSIVQNKSINHLLVSMNFRDKRYVMLEDAGIVYVESLFYNVTLGGV